MKTFENPLLGHLRASPVAAGWVALLRWVLALAFVLPGVEKLAGHRIYANPGAEGMALFDAMHQVGPYWRFLGLGEVVGGLLLLPSRTAAAGAMICLPIVANIVVLLNSLAFHTSDRVAGMIILGGHLAILAWEWPRVAPLVAPGLKPGAVRAVRAAAADAWRRPRLRLALAALATLWLVVHIADRLSNP